MPHGLMAIGMLDRMPVNCHIVTKDFNSSFNSEFVLFRLQTASRSEKFADSWLLPQGGAQHGLLVIPNAAPKSGEAWSMASMRLFCFPCIAHLLALLLDSFLSSR
mmetsp:Transcript_10574/g.21745  ORF Transcript_10574/g.21745 Transcript_10574/m.21745 type:complete len:105 (+) Transcript_10574:1909-2223(+)